MAVNPPGVPMHTAANAVPLTERILLVTLFMTMLLSSVAFIEPSPQDGMMIFLWIASVIAGVKIERKVTLLIMPLVLWNVAGLMALMRIADGAPWPYARSLQYSVTTLYMSVAAIVYACLFAQNTMSRLASMRTAYIASAVVGAAAGISGHFHLFPGAEMFEENGGRALGMFKDPNVYAPYLIWPALFVMSRLLSRGFYPRDIAILGILLGGIFLSFSRGAWANFIASAVLTLALMVLTAPTPRLRMRITMVSLAGVAGIAVFLVLLLSLDSVSTLFANRAQLIQPYDVGQGGRFRFQELALGAILDFPLGMGPFEFSRTNGQQAHNVYLQAFVVYGWVGGASYILMLLATCVIGFRAVLLATPWQPYLITAFATFAGAVGEGFIVDTDHWRHFFLLLGMVWGLSAATVKAARPQRLTATRGCTAIAAL